MCFARRAVGLAAVAAALAPTSAHAASWRLLPPLAGSGSRPVVAVQPDGRALAAWTDGGPDTQFLVSRPISASRKLGRAVTTSQADRVRELAPDGQGNWLLSGGVFEGDPTHAQGECCLRALVGVSRAGGGFDTRRLTPAGENHSEPDLAVAAAGAHAVAAVGGFDFPAGPVKVSERAPSHGFAAPRQVGTATGVIPGVAIDEAGRTHVVWSEGGPYEGGGLLYARELRSGRYSRPVRISRVVAGHVTSIQRVRFARDRNGRLVAVYVACDRTEDDAPAGCRVEATVRRAGAEEFGRPRVLDKMPFIDDIGFAMNARGRAIASWDNCEVGPQCVVRAAALRPGAASFQPHTSVTGERRGFASPVVAVSARGHAVIAFTDFESLLVAYQRPGHRFGAVRAVAPLGGTYEAPSVALDAAGRAVVVFEQRDAVGDGTRAIRAAIYE